MGRWLVILLQSRVLYKSRPPSPTWPGREMPTDLKGVFSADVVRRLHCRHPEAQERDATQDALLLLICRVNRGPGETHVPVAHAEGERERRVSALLRQIPINTCGSSTACQDSGPPPTKHPGCALYNNARDAHRR